MARPRRSRLLAPPPKRGRLPRGPLLVGALLVCGLLLLRQRYCASPPPPKPDAGARARATTSRDGAVARQASRAATRAATRRFQAMGTWVTIEAPSPLLARSTYLAMRSFERVERLASRWQATSALSKLQRAAGRGPQPVPPELWQLLSRARALGELTGGAYDLSWAALAGLWDLRKGVAPSASALKQALKHVDYRRLKLERRGVERLATLPAGMRLGLGGVAKGWALDAAAKALRAAKVPSASISAGGQVLVFGGRRGKGESVVGPWRVGIRDPLPKARTFFAVVRLKAGNVATSGDYERFFERDGVRYHHILDPRTGRPSRGLRSASVVDLDSATRADALATALMVLGRERGLALVERLPRVEALLVDAVGRVHQSSGAKRWIELLRAPRLVTSASSAPAKPAESQQR